MTPWNTPDLSNITFVLKGMVDASLATSTLNVSKIKTSCDAPDTRKAHEGQCSLTIYLLHVGRDPHWRNTPVQGGRGQLNAAQPLSLTLSYLLSAWCPQDFASEQLAMSIALQTFHSAPIVTKAMIDNQLGLGWPEDGEFVISLQADTIEEMSRLWQAFTVPMRLSALIKVSVVFLAPPAAPATSSTPPQTVNLQVAQLASPPPPTLPPAATPRLAGGASIGVGPAAPDTPLADIAARRGPLAYVGDSTKSPGQPPTGLIQLVGVNLDDAQNASDVYLSAPGGPTWNVTAWRWSPGPKTDPNRLALALPVSYADATQTPPPPAATPTPGLYTLCVGDATPTGFRSNAIPLAIAPRVDAVSQPPFLAPDGAGVFTIKGAGFVASAATAVSFAGAPLAYSGAGAAAGAFAVDAAGQTITFKAPNGTTSGYYPVQLTVNGVAATVCWVATL